MRSWSYSEIKSKVEDDLDIKDELFITTDELMGYCNEAIDEAEAEIQGIYEDYFLTSESIDLVSGTSEYALPTDIYANKIRALIYSNGSTIYPVKRLKGSKEFVTLPLVQSGDDYRYILKNTAGTGPRLVLYPASRETSSSVLTIWYIRNAARITDDSDTCDIPEFANFIMQYMKVRCYEKEGHPNLDFAVAALEKQRKLMVDTLTGMVPDGDDEVERDLSFYEEHF
jgi:hypothetical protein